MRTTLLAPLALLIACGGHGSSSDFFGSPGPDAGGGATDAGGNDAGSIVGDDAGNFGDANPPPQGGCTAQATNFVYVISATGSLYSFAPDKKIFTKIGDVHCPSSGNAQYNSMAVDRSATAWVNVIDFNTQTLQMTGALYKVSTKDASCDPNPAVSLTLDWHQVGMGFSVDTQGGSSETLFLAGIGQGKLGRLDMGTKSVVTIGSVTGDPELTGTGDARLYGFFAKTNPPSVGQLDKSSAAVTAPASMSGLQQPNDWAFSFWGGHFYLYTQSPSETSSRVTDYDPVTQKVDNAYMTNVGFSITGAGVSTCAPTHPPK
jgi:hypothetical protein